MSNINFTNINENFPVAGQDNDTQVFRDNFDSIKTALSVAKTEITDLQDNAARTDQDSDFNANSITNAKLINNVDVVNDAGNTPGSTDTVDYENGNYQIFTITNTPFTFDLLNFPSAGETVGKVTLELKGNNSATKLISFTLSGSGATSKKKNSFPTVIGGHDLELSSATDPVILEIWRHTESTFYFKYIGQFS